MLPECLHSEHRQTPKRASILLATNIDSMHWPRRLDKKKHYYTLSPLEISIVRA